MTEFIIPPSSKHLNIRPTLTAALAPSSGRLATMPVEEVWHSTGTMCNILFISMNWKTDFLERRKIITNLYISYLNSFFNRESDLSGF